MDAIRRARFPHPGFYLPVAVDYAPLADALSGKRSARDVLDEMTEQTQLKLEQFRAQPGRAFRNPSWGGSLGSGGAGADGGGHRLSAGAGRDDAHDGLVQPRGQAPEGRGGRRRGPK